MSIHRSFPPLNYFFPFSPQKMFTCLPELFYPRFFPRGVVSSKKSALPPFSRPPPRRSKIAWTIVQFLGFLELGCPSIPFASFQRVDFSQDLCSRISSMTRPILTPSSVIFRFLSPHCPPKLNRFPFLLAPLSNPRFSPLPFRVGVRCCLRVFSPFRVNISGARLFSDVFPTLSSFSFCPLTSRGTFTRAG